MFSKLLPRQERKISVCVSLVRHPRRKASIEAYKTALPEDEKARVELSIVMPCLNEGDTLEACIAKAQRALRQHNIPGEIIVADNDSSDESVDIATRMGARVIHVEAKGYGSALKSGIDASRGQFIVMGDADDSYDFGEIPPFVEKPR